MLSPDLQRIAHIRGYCLNIQEFQLRFGTTFEAFQADLAYQQSVSFCIFQIGELCGGLSENYRKDTSCEIQWNAIRGLRNIVAHDYGNIKLDILWDVVTSDIPTLKQFCDQQLSETEL